MLSEKTSEMLTPQYFSSLQCDSLLNFTQDAPPSSPRSSEIELMKFAGFLHAACKAEVLWLARLTG